jgi:preprotein translocase subunit YajC
MHSFSFIASSSESSGGGATSLLILLLIPVALYVLMIRPQRRRLKTQQSMQSSIEIGDEVVTNSGIYGFITGIDGDKYWLEVDDDVQLRIASAAIQGRVTAPSESESDKDKDDDKDDSGDAFDNIGSEESGSDDSGDDQDLGTTDES